MSLGMAPNGTLSMLIQSQNLVGFARIGIGSIHTYLLVCVKPIKAKINIYALKINKF